MTVAIRSLLATQAKATALAAVPTLAIQIDANTPFSPPEDALWMRLSFVDGNEVRFPGRAQQLVRRPILMFVDIFGPQGQGDGAVSGLAESMRTGIRGYVGAGYRFTNIQEGPEGNADAFYRKQIVGVFRNDFRV
jgi:hypothetical protein